MKTNFERLVETIDGYMSENGMAKIVIRRETTLDDLGFDSLDRVEVVMAVEEEFDVEIDDESIEALNTVGKLLDFLDVNVNSAKEG